MPRVLCCSLCLLYPVLLSLCFSQSANATGRGAGGGKLTSGSGFSMPVAKKATGFVMPGQHGPVTKSVPWTSQGTGDSVVEASETKLEILFERAQPKLIKVLKENGARYNPVVMLDWCLEDGINPVEFLEATKSSDPAIYIPELSSLYKKKNKKAHLGIGVVDKLALYVIESSVSEVHGTLMAAMANFRSSEIPPVYQAPYAKKADITELRKFATEIAGLLAVDQEFSEVRFTNATNSLPCFIHLYLQNVWEEFGILTSQEQLSNIMSDSSAYARNYQKPHLSVAELLAPSASQNFSLSNEQVVMALFSLARFSECSVLTGFVQENKIHIAFKKALKRLWDRNKPELKKALAILSCHVMHENFLSVPVPNMPAFSMPSAGVMGSEEMEVQQLLKGNEVWIDKELSRADLNFMKANGRSIRLVDEIMHKWKDIGRSMGLKESSIINIDSECFENRRKLDKVLVEWFNNACGMIKGATCSWRYFIPLLEDNDLGEIAKELIDFLNSGYHQ